MADPVDAMRCYCGQWVSVPHLECLGNHGFPTSDDQEDDDG